MITITCMCDECSGTGLYQGFMEKKDEAVVCVRCGGRGYQELKLNEFSGRKKRRGVKRIRFGSGLFIDNPNKAKWMSYKEFEKTIPRREV